METKALCKTHIMILTVMACVFELCNTYVTKDGMMSQFFPSFFYCQAIFNSLCTTCHCIIWPSLVQIHHLDMKPTPNVSSLVQG